MVRIHNNNLVIEINPQSESPLEKLGNIQQGLYDMMLCIGFSTAPNKAKENALHHLHNIMQASLLNEFQYEEINKGIANAAIPSQLFTTSK